MKKKSKKSRVDLFNEAFGTSDEAVYSGPVLLIHNMTFNTYQTIEDNIENRLMVEHATVEFGKESPVKNKRIGKKGDKKAPSGIVTEADIVEYQESRKCKKGDFPFCDKLEAFLKNIPIMKGYGPHEILEQNRVSSIYTIISEW